LEESTKLNAMAEQGANYNNFQQQLATAKGAYDLAVATWPSDFIPEAQVDIQKAFNGWGLVLLM
jgi:ABC-type branched-subunit amino acid transport system substrate-binding protein